MSTYRVCFRGPDPNPLFGPRDLKTVIREAPPNYGVATFREGFWVDEKLDFCVASRSRYWIPPHQVSFVEKVD